VSQTRQEPQSSVSEEALQKGFEPSDVPPRGVAYAFLGLFAGLAVSAALVAGLLALISEWRGPGHATAIEASQVTPPLPRLQIAPEVDRAAFEAEAHRTLGDYGWTDRKSGLARIPIEEAMQMLAQHGWPDAPAGKAPGVAASATEAPPR
jgi:hypothetical protein